ncbi:HAD family hydrolase [Patescibacteria group bacterium]|nr:HAD family hydrolase [Patescibacteria group bacterium]
MYLLEKYVVDNKKSFLIFDFDKTMFELIINWEQYFENVETDLIFKDRQLYRDYQKGVVSWCNMQNLYIERYGKVMRDQICLNNKISEVKLFQKAIINKPLIDLINKISNVSMFIWSSNTKELIEMVLKKNHILKKFYLIVSRNDLYYLKPNPEGFKKIHQTSIPLNKYLFIGDSQNDAQAAKSIGIDFYEIDYFR